MQTFFWLVTQSSIPHERLLKQWFSGGAGALKGSLGRGVLQKRCHKCRPFICSLHTLLKASAPEHTLFKMLNSKIVYPVKKLSTLKTIPCSAAHTRIGQIRDGPLFFDGGWKIFKHTDFFICWSYCKQLLLSLSSCEHFFFLHTIYFSVYSLCKQFISKFSNPPS